MLGTFSKCSHAYLDRDMVLKIDYTATDVAFYRHRSERDSCAYTPAYHQKAFLTTTSVREREFCLSPA